MRSKAGGSARRKRCEPGRLDHAAAGGRGPLLVLGGEIHFPDGRANAFERGERLARRIERLARQPPERPSARERRLDGVRLVLFGDRRKRDDVPAALPQDVAGEIVLVQALHDDDDRALLLVVEPRIERRIEPVVGGGAAALRHRVGRLQGVVDQDHVGAAAGHDAADRSREPKAPARRRELGQRLARRSEPGRKQRLVPAGGHDRPAVAGELVREVLGVGDVDDGERRIVAEEPRRQGDRGGERFQVPRRHVDDEPLHAALADALKLRRQNLGVPGRRKRPAGVKLGEAADEEGIEVRPDGGLDLGGGEHGFGGRLRRIAGRVPGRRCEERSDEAIHAAAAALQMDCFAALAMT